MKRILYLIAIFFFFISAGFVKADEGWVIDNFNSNISILETGEVKVTEIINVDFNTLSKHGIYRDIPYIYEKDGEKTYTEIDIKSVIQNNKKAKFSTSNTDGYVRVKIGDPDKTISGKNTYEIEYSAKGVLRSFDEYDEIYWNVTGNAWPVGITSASATVELPADGVLKKTCFEGYVGSTAECMILSESSNSVKFKNLETLSESQGLTVVVGYKKGLVPILNVERPKTFWEKFIAWPSITTLGIGLISGIGTILYLWHKNGRDYWFGQNIFGKKDQLGRIKPIGAHEATVVEFTAPEGLRPAEIGVLMDERADTLDVSATIVDLASRGYLSIVEIPKKWLFGKVDYNLVRTKAKGVDGLMNYEKMLINELFSNRSEVKLSDLKLTFYDELKKIKEELYREVVAKNLFATDPEKVRGKYFAGAFIMLFLGIFSIGYTIGFGNVYLADLCISLIISGLVLLGFAKYMPRRTAYGREIYRRVKGYRLFIDKAETHRQKFFEKKNLFNEVLPYTIVFGLTGKFADAMKEMGVKIQNPTWYTGTSNFNTHTFASSMNSFSGSMSTAIASTPSSSGGFSGGGSSGGGFSGGGGGSW
ncbi:MAG TPA: DUF2207 domain-containing protein [Candidatus Limnocylindrales bacterium]|nr:DUF2207 domain-containing protein [Candidatus Limnocylindrales bacterium]